MALNVANVLLSSLLAHYESEKSEALAILGLYINNPQPVAEHSDILGELKKWTSKLAQAEENLEVLRKYIVEPSQES